MVKDFGRVGVIGCGGGYTGAYSVGFIKAMNEFGIVPYIARASSVNALNFGSAVQCGWDSRILEKVWSEVVEKRGPKLVFDLKWMRMALRLRKPDLLPNNGIRELVGNLDVHKIIESKIKLEIQTVDESVGEEVIFTNHNEEVLNNPEILRDAVIASANFPGVFPAHYINGRPHCDIVDNNIVLDVRDLLKSGCDRVFIFINSSATYKKARKPTWFSRFLAIFYRIANANLKDAEALYGEKITIFRPVKKIETLSRTTFKKGDIVRAIDLACEDGIKILSELK